MIELPAGSPVADAVTAAARAIARRDARAVDRAYRDAVALADGDLAPALAADHVAALLGLGALTLAGRRCRDHLAAWPQHLPLVSARARVRSATGEHEAADADAARALPGAVGVERAALLRVRGLAAADRGEVDPAADALAEALALFTRAGHAAGVAAVERDRVVIAIRLHDEAAVDAALAQPEPLTPIQRLSVASALRKRLRYEEALHVMLGAVDDADPALRAAVLTELARLLRLLRRDDAADRLLPLLAEADPSGRSTARVRPEAPAPLSPAFDARVQHARRLIEGDRLPAAEAVVVALRGVAHTDRDAATWHLAAGELELARGAFGDAVRQLALAADRAAAPAMTEVRVLALRRLGLACFRAGDESKAAECWAAAHRAEEAVAAAQDSDAVRVRMLAAADTEHDHAVRATALAARDDPALAAAAVVAMEAARGATLLESRALPRLRDVAGTWRWLRSMTADLRRTQAIWLTHVTADRVHHAVLTRRGVRLTSTPADVVALTDAVEEFLSYLHPDDLPLSAASGDFEAALADIAARIGLAEAVALIPHTVTRLTTIASGPLGDVPWAALATDDGHLVRRFALSDLPSLSVRGPLRARARASRGDAGLQLSPPDGLTEASSPGYTPKTGAAATMTALADAAPTHRVVRVDCHGLHDPDEPGESWLALADGRLTAERLATIPLRGTVTLGACESGMAQPRGRDEPVGFVRSALLAGASAVVAARWVAVDGTAAELLDRFGENLRHLPRDLALQRAQLSIQEHPARWACWTLYGDPGRQTAAGPIRRFLRSRRAPVR